MASAVNPIVSAVNASDAASQTTTSSNSAPTEQMFLQLLVAQMKNQDPESPSDPTQFVAELAQFSELEQVIGIRTDIESYAAAQTGSQASSQTGSQTNTQTTNPSTNQTQS